MLYAWPFFQAWLRLGGEIGGNCYFFETTSPKLNTNVKMKHIWTCWHVGTAVQFDLTVNLCRSGEKAKLFGKDSVVNVLPRLDDIQFKVSCIMFSYSFENRGSNMCYCFRGNWFSRWKSINNNNVTSWHDRCCHVVMSLNLFYVKCSFIFNMIQFAHSRPWCKNEKFTSYFRIYRIYTQNFIGIGQAVAEEFCYKHCNTKMLFITLDWRLRFNM